MNGLDFPFEALAFNPVNLSPVLAAAFNNLWALLVFVAAALISFKHLRPSTSPNLLPEDKDDENVNEDVEVDVEGEGKAKLLHETVLHENLVGEEVVLTRGNSKKVFTVYYEERENEEGCVGDDDVYGGDEKEEDEEEEKTDVMVEKWTVEMRGEELGWYDYQDRSVIDGNVVRLWDGEKEKSTSPRRRRSRRNIIVSSIFVSDSTII